MLDKFQPIRHIPPRIMEEYYRMIEKDLEEIVNAPSTINRIIKYYCVPPTHEMIMYLIFFYDGKIYFIKEYDLTEFAEHQRLKDIVELWAEESVRRLLVDSVVFPGGE